VDVVAHEQFDRIKLQKEKGAKKVCCTAVFVFCGHVG
jgi:hypothetical protein